MQQHIMRTRAKLIFGTVSFVVDMAEADADASGLVFFKSARRRRSIYPAECDREM